MTPQYAVVSCDKSHYLDFWPLVSRMWKRIGIEPVLSVVGEGNYPVWPLLPVEFQAQWARFYTAASPRFRKAIVIVSDIDMLPLSKWFFVDKLAHIPGDAWVHLNPCMETYGRVPACYNVASGERFADMVGKSLTWEGSLQAVWDSAGPNRWFADEDWLTDHFPKDATLMPRDGGQNGHRIDRPDWRWDDDLVRQGFYYDAHCPRPYSEHRQSIERLANLLLQS